MELYLANQQQFQLFSSLPPAVWLSLMLLAECPSVHIQSPRETAEKVLFTAMEMESTSNTPPVFAHLMGGGSHFLSICFYCHFMHTNV